MSKESKKRMSDKWTGEASVEGVEIRDKDGNLVGIVGQEKRSTVAEEPKQRKKPKP